VVYVHLKTLDIVAEDRRTYGLGLIRDLRNSVDVWDREWTTLTIFREDSEIRCLQDQWKPHFFPSDVTPTDLPRLNVLALEVQSRLKNRVYVIQLQAQVLHILKICLFEYELPYMIREVLTYNVLAQWGCELVPCLIAFVYERSEEQIIGFICEKLEGRFAGPDDYIVCKRSLQQIHSYGFVHGDLNRFNIIITRPCWRGAS